MFDNHQPATTDPDPEVAAIHRLRTAQAASNRADAARVRAVADVADRCEYPEFAHLEVATALRLTRRSAERLTHLAWDLVHRLGNLLALLDVGVLDLGRARVIADEVVHLPDEDARAVVDGLADRAPDLTTGQLRAAVRRAVLAIDPDAARQRYEHAVADRGVVLHQTSDGTGTIEATGLAPDRAAAAMAHVNACARHLRGSGDRRTMDQLRADVLVDLLTGGGESVAANVNLAIDEASLIAFVTGDGDARGDLGGWGPVLDDVARQVLARDDDGSWHVRVTDPDTHRTITSVATRRRPTAAQRRAVLADMPRCGFPGCRVPAADCDIDHRIRAVDAGPTLTGNLVPLCRHHHRAKDEGGWRYDIGVDGSLEWTSPLGQLVTVDPRGP